MQNLKELNNLIKEKIKTSGITDIYAAIAHNNHLPFNIAVKLGAAFGAVDECDTYDGWNSRGIRIRRGEHFNYGIPELCAGGVKAKNYFSVQQTTAANRNKRTLQSLFKYINDYAFMKVSAEKIDFAAICAAVRNYATDNGIEFKTDFESVIVTGIASILAYTCNDSTNIQITPTVFPERDYLENAALLKEVGGYASDLLELIKISESKVEERRSDKLNANSSVSAAHTDSGTQIKIFDTQSKPEKPETLQPDSVAERSTVQLLPMYQSYLSKKAAYPGALVFQRVGDFYEVLGEDDTKKLSEILDLTITGRMVGLPERMPMVGIPFHAIDKYISRLLEDGFYKKIILADELSEDIERVIERAPEVTVSNTVLEAPVAQEPSIEFDDEVTAEEQRLTFGGAKTRFKDNLEALKVYRRLSDTGAEATSEEKAILKKYIGWGGLSEVFDTRNNAWAEERRELTKYLSPYEYDAAQSTVTDAFYTPFIVIKEIYKALERFGVKGNNRILEPSMGVGNFFRVLPDNIKEKSELYGVEIDNVTGGIAKLIYPDAKITVKGFEKTLLPANSFDIVVGNVPFGNSKPLDIEKDYGFNLHNFVIAKSVDKTRAGGIIALITTSATMNEYNNAARKYISDRAKLLGAIRLPYDTFKVNANTSVTTDILFLQKRKEIIDSSDNWISSDWNVINDNLDKDYLNEYFVEHPEMVLGEYKSVSGAYGPRFVPKLNEGETLQDKLSKAIAQLPANVFTPREHKAEAIEIEQLPADDSVKNFCFTIINGKLYQRQGEFMINLPIKTTPKNALDRISAMIDLRSEVRHILKIQLNNCSDEELKAAQVILNSHYDDFVKKYGNLHSAVNKALFQNDADFQLLLSLEFEKTETKEIFKADIFSKRSISPITKPQRTDSVLDALQVCKSERGGVDIKFIEDLTGKDYDTVVKELKGIIFKNPQLASDYDKYRGFEAAEKYLSGDVKTKLQEAIQAADADEEYTDNVRALEEVQPATIPAEDIIIGLGATWIDTSIYEQFICEDILKIPYIKSGYGERVKVSYNDLINGYIVDANLYNASYSEANINTYGTSAVSAVELFEQALNLKSPNIYDASRDADGKTIRIFNPKKTALAREKQTKLKTEFSQWIFSDAKRREYLTQKYNEQFNRYRLANYDGSSLTFPEMTPEITLNAHQKNAIYRGMADGTVLLHHCVGAGKTFEMDALIMKLRQSGLAHKPLQIVPKATLEQAEIEFRTLYPNANLLVASNDDFKKDRLKAFTAKIALGDWDCIIMSSSQFDRINVSPERQAKKLGEELEKITETLRRAQKSNGRKDNGLTAKRLANILKQKRAELDRLMLNDKTDDFIRFEDLGVDYLFLDEAHFYKNKFFFTKMNNVAGINSTASKRATSLDLKIDYINELHGGDKGVVFATGTPISNSMSEMYTMQSYLQKSLLQKMGLDTFDAWASTFGEIVKSYELKPAGNGYRTRERFASFVNVPELMTLYGLFADVKMLDELKLPVPTVKYEKVIAPKTPEVIELMIGISERAERINSGNVDPTEDNMLKITTDGKKIALSPRLYDITLSEPENSKIQLCAENVAKIYHATANEKSTQMIFCDSSTPKSGMSYENYNSKENFNVYFEIKKKLVQLGVAENEIAFIHDYEESAKIKLKEAMTAGKIRVLLGSTSKCGTGLNVQKKLIAGHHLDIPYRPSDMEQREGRIIRQGNENKNVTIYTYAQEGTFDVYLFQILETKQKFIKQLLDFKIGSRKIEDIADNSVLSYGEMKAAISGNPAIIELEQLKQKIDNLNLLHSEYQRNLFRLQNKISNDYPREIQRMTDNIANLKKDLAMIKDNKTEEFQITINGSTFQGRTEEVGELFIAALKAAEMDGVPFAKYCGFDIIKSKNIRIDEMPKLLLKGAGVYTISINDSGVGALMRLNNLITDFPDRLESENRALRQAQTDLEEAQKEITRPFARADELTAALTRIDELRTLLDISDVATDDIVIDSADKSNDNDSLEADENNYRRLPLEHMDKDDIYFEIAQRFTADEITEALKQRERNRATKLYDIKTSGLDYANISSYSSDDLKAAREKIHSYVTKRGFVIEDLIPAGYGTTNAIVHRVMKDAEGHTTLDDYLIALNYNVNTGEWAQGKYDFNSLKSVTDFYNKEYATANNMYYQNVLITQNEVLMPIDKIKSTVKERITNEFEGYKQELFSKGIEEVFFNSSETYVKSELRDTLNSEAVPLSDDVYRALYVEGNGILNKLYLNFVGSEYASVNSFEETAQFIEDYCRHYQSAIMNGEEVEKTQSSQEIIYFGKNNDDTAFYYLPEKLSFDTLPEIKVEAFRYVIAAPVCYIDKERLDNLGIQFLKIDRDISQEDLKNNSTAIQNMEDAVSRVLDSDSARIFAEAEARLDGIDLTAEAEYLRFTRYGSPINAVHELPSGKYVAVINNYAQGEHALPESYPASYIIAHDYNADTGEFTSAAYGFETYEEARGYYKDNYDVDLGESLLPELSEDYRRKATEEAIRRELQEENPEQFLQEPLYGVVYNWKGLKEENSVYTAAQLMALDENFNPEYEVQDGAFAANKTYITYRLNSEDDVKAFLTGSKNDTFDGAEIPEGWYWETTTDNLFTGEPNQTTIALIDYFSLTKTDLRMSDKNIEEVMQISPEIKLNAFIDEGLKELKWLEGRTSGFTEEEIDDITSDLKAHFENSVFDESADGDYDGWYDSFVEDRLVPILNERLTQPENIDTEKAKAEFFNEKHSMAATRPTDLYNAPLWNKAILPNFAISLKGDKNIKIVMPEGSEHRGSEFWVSKKFIKNATDKTFKLILPNNYTVRLKTPQGGELSLNAKQVVTELLEYARTYEKKPVTEILEQEVIDLDKKPKGQNFEKNFDALKELNLSELRQELIKNLVTAMENNDIEWLRSWSTSLPKNGTTGREYAGINNLLLSFEKSLRGYSDSRWCTFNQIQNHKWKLKKGSRAAQIEVVKFIDKTTKKEFNEQSVEGMTDEERKEYWKKNVYPIMKKYAVFNADCIEGIPAEQITVLNDKERNEHCEQILINYPATITYDGGNDAYYRLSDDTIHLPKRERFYSKDDFYHIALHEIGHSTGHPSRLNRNMSGMRNSENYAREELCAEIGSLFIAQSLSLKLSDAQLKSSAAYLKFWAKNIRKDPTYLFTAITEANKISKYVLGLQFGASAAKNIAAQEMKLEAMQRGSANKHTGSEFANIITGKTDTSILSNNDNKNIME